LYRCTLDDARAGRIKQSIDLEGLQPPERRTAGRGATP
jgi:hypothetical protein